MKEGALRSYIQLLPDAPGVYRFYSTHGTLIYVGKAKSLRKRVSSYFTRSVAPNRKTQRLVEETERIEYTLAPSEFEALLLENNLIKQNQPKYNILLKDDKTFPYLCIVKENFPRIISTRKFVPGQGEYFGPYSSVSAMKNVLELVRKLYNIRTCSLQLTPTAIASKKYKVCLEYHLGNCKGPCENLQSEAEYLQDIAQARNILKGNIAIVENHFSTEMDASAAHLHFERAQVYKEKLDLLDKFQSKSLVVNKALTDIDVLTILSREDYAYLNYLVIKEGSIIFSKSLEVRKKLGETEEEILALVLVDVRQQSQSSGVEVLSNLDIPLLPEKMECTVPKIGDKRKLVLLSLKNAAELEKQKELLRAEKMTRKHEVLSVLQQDLQLTELPRVIECFDNSNFQGTTPVASMVRFVNGKPEKKGYRHFNIKTVTGPDDFASMKEIVTRRYTRLLEEQTALPNLIVVDGGKGQLSSAVEALTSLHLYGKVPVIGIAKKLEEIYYPGDSLPLLINKKSPGLQLLQQIRDEAHRFAITFHRHKRTGKQVQSELDQVKGLGAKTIEKLLQHFKSVAKLKQADRKEIEAVIGPSKTKLLLNHFN